MDFPGICAVVTDIEGTTSSISFVHDVLFPYARARIPRYVHDHANDLGDILKDVAQETGQSELPLDECIRVLLSWMDEDRKITPLKALQGKIWAEGYVTSALRGHVFSDVAANLKKWHQAGIKLHVYSSGSIAAQKQIFGYSEAGDLTPYFTGYFDTTTGGKKDAASYAKIAEQIGIPEHQILFLSDNPDELAAAKMAGYCILGLNRPGNTFDLGSFPAVENFDEIKLEIKHDSAA